MFLLIRVTDERRVATMYNEGSLSLTNIWGGVLGTSFLCDVIA